MSNITKLVPPLELCKKIPEGEFKDSALVCWDNKGEIAVGLREKYGEFDIFFPVYPAPTFEEIWKELPDTVKVDKWGGVHIKNDVKNGYGVSNTNGAAAALRLWFKLKGMKNG